MENTIISASKSAGPAISTEIRDLGSENSPLPYEFAGHVKQVSNTSSELHTGKQLQDLPIEIIQMITGIFFALGAGLLWGLIFVGPLLVPDYPGALQSAGRYVAFGLIALPLAWYDRHRLKRLQRQDWVEA